MADLTPPQRLRLALAEMVEQGELPPCSDGSGRWVSEDRDARATAAADCAGCALLSPCGAAADDIDENFGVWGGRDRTPRLGRPRRGVA
jgi:hypothetical protein